MVAIRGVYTFESVNCMQSSRLGESVELIQATIHDRRYVYMNRGNCSDVVAVLYVLRNKLAFFFHLLSSVKWCWLSPHTR